MLATQDAGRVEQLMTGFYAKNNFEVFGNAYTKDDSYFMNMVRSVNLFSDDAPQNHVMDTMMIYKYWKFGACLLESKFITSNNLLKIKQDSECKYVNNYIIEKSITLLGAPRDFIQNLKKYQLNPKKK